MPLQVSGPVFMICRKCQHRVDTVYYDLDTKTCTYRMSCYCPELPQWYNVLDLEEYSQPIIVEKNSS